MKLFRRASVAVCLPAPPAQDSITLAHERKLRAARKARKVKYQLDAVLLGGERTDLLAQLETAKKELNEAQAELDSLLAESCQRKREGRHDRLTFPS